MLVVIFVSCSDGKQTRATKTNALLTKGPSKKAIAEWNGQKYSMFIHFGLYSVPAGIWKEEKVTRGYSEQIRAHGNISREEFRELAKEFNPTRWNADSVALLAKKAGMKSIVITSKHHDGFAMYHTKYSDFNIVDATPYKKDILKELAAACEKHGLKFGVYFSLIDWDFPQALPISTHNSDSIPPAHHQLNLNQVEELMTGYGPVSEIWFDMGKPSLQQSRELVAMVRKYQPDCLVSGRIWNDQGDFAVMGDNASPDFRMGTLWQTPASMFEETWGYRSWQERGDARDKALEKLRALVNIVSKGGNYLLNIGPKGDGSILAFEQEVLLAIGQWLKIHREAIYDTKPAPLPEQEWGVLTHKPGKLFLFFPYGPPEGPIILKGMRSGIRSARLLAQPSITVTVDDSSVAPVMKIQALDTSL
jgi:alpha-L-fucosidase